MTTSITVAEIPIAKYDYTTVRAGINNIVSNIRASGIKFDYVVCLVRGGCVPGTMISHMLDVPLVPIIWSTRDHIMNESNTWIPVEINNGKKVLIVEDIIDTGETLKQLFKDWDSSLTFQQPLNHANIYVASLIYNCSQDMKCDFYATRIDRETDITWFDFFWEQDN